MFDLDGVFCLDPPDERDEEAYISYIKDATPLFIPSTAVGGIVTFRLLKNQKITEEWLAKNGVKYGFLCMFNAQTWEERNNAGIDSGTWKGEIYKSMPNYRLFIESNVQQAERIYEISGKPVLCIENNKLYGGA